VAHVPTVLPTRHVLDTLQVIAPKVKPVNGASPVLLGHIIGCQAAASADEAAKEKQDP
jgi:hypothetical protein